jgi:hypothetical protein
MGLIFFAWHRPSAVPAVVQTAAVSNAVTPAVLDEAVAKAVATAVDKAHAEDLRLTKAALAAVDDKYAQKQRNLMIAMQENLDLQRKHLNTYAILSSQERMGAGQ